MEILNALALFTNFGTAYVLPLHEVPATTGYGDPIQKFFGFKDGEKLVGAVSLDPRMVTVEASALLVISASGQLLRVPLNLHQEVSTRAGRKLIRLAKGDSVAAVQVVPADDEGHVLIATSKGNATKLSLADVPLLSAAGKGRRQGQQAGAAGDGDVANLAHSECFALHTTYQHTTRLEPPAFL